MYRTVITTALTCLFLVVTADAQVANATAQPPQLRGTSPTTGSGNSATFTMQASDVDGDINRLDLFVGPALSPTAGCHIVYKTEPATIALLGGAGWQSRPAAESGTLANSHCTITGPATITTANGTVTVTLSVSFSGRLAGAQNIYTRIYDAQGLATEWVVTGTWTIGSGFQPTRVRVTD